MTSKPPYYSLGIQFLLMSNITLNNVTDAEMGDNYKTVVFRLSKDCRDQYIRLDRLDKVEFTSNRLWSDRKSPVEAGVSCRAHFMTDHDDKGICIENNGLYFKRPGLKIEFSTTQMGSEKVLRREFHRFRKWCTVQSIATITVTSDLDIADQDDEYRFSFWVFNVSKSAIQKQYIMDSFKYCDRTYDLEAGEEIEILSQRYPRTRDLPLTCQMSLTSKSGDEYEELCVRVKNYEKTHECRSSLEIKGFLSRFWREKLYLGCNDTLSKVTEEEMCSSDKKLVFDLKRTSDNDTGFFMHATVQSKWHPKWELLSQEESELRGLGFMKGLTYFIAAVDSLAGILAALLASMFRHPQWFWKDWVESKNTNLTCEAVHYEAGSYPEPPNQEVEKITEAAAY